MVFYTEIIGIKKFSVFLMQIGQDLRKTKGPLRGTVWLLEGI